MRDKTVLTGYQLSHNYIVTYESLKGKTPAEVCGIEVKGRTNGFYPQRTRLKKVL